MGPLLGEEAFVDCLAVRFAMRSMVRNRTATGNNERGVLGRDLRNAAFDVAHMALECLAIEYEPEVSAEFGQDVAG